MSVIKKESPAESFEEGFALGNGRLGVKVYGSPSHKIFSLNEESIWSQDFVNRNNWIRWTESDAHADRQLP